MLQDGQNVKHIKCGNNFAYVLENNDIFLNTDYKVLHSQTSGNFVQCMRLLYNGKTELFYLVDEYRSVSSIIQGLKPDRLITIMINLLTSIIEVKNNGFLNLRNIDLSWEQIFVDVNTLQVKLVYLPINVKMFENYDGFEKTLRSNLLEVVKAVVGNSDNGLISLVADTRSSLEDLHSKLKLYKFNDSTPSPSHVDSSLKMVAIGAPEYFEIILDKNEVVVGKKADLVDVVISFNKMISRKHCKFVKNGSQYYVMDEESANGTFVNNQRVYPGQSCPINKGDIVRLADSNFKIV